MKPFLLVAVLLLSAVPARAEGALAIGIIPGDYAKGVSAGWATGYGSQKEAEDTALKRCLEEPNAPAEIRKLCRLVDSFRNRCVSVAIDPQDGETGTGWAIASTSEEADQEALSLCRKSAGANRQQACQVSTRGCDGTAK